MPHVRLSTVIALSLGAFTLPACAVTIASPYLAPSPYLQASDSPFAGLSFSIFQLEDFEDGALNTLGVTTTTPGRILGPGDQTDSVDADDGVVDGSGAGGHSMYSDGFTSMAFNFSAATLGSLPTHVGVVWTDVGTTPSTTGVGTVEFEAFDAGGSSLGVLSAPDLGNGSADGRVDATAEDRFLGAIVATGISRIEIRMPTSGDWEIDHLQYGVASVPLPPAAWLFGSACAALARRRRAGQAAA